MQKVKRKVGGFSQGFSKVRGQNVIGCTILQSRSKWPSLGSKFWYKPNLDLRNPMVKLNFRFDLV